MATVTFKSFVQSLRAGIVEGVCAEPLASRWKMPLHLTAVGCSLRILEAEISK